MRFITYQSESGPAQIPPGEEKLTDVKQSPKRKQSIYPDFIGSKKAEGFFHSASNNGDEVDRLS